MRNRMSTDDDGPPNGGKGEKNNTWSIRSRRGALEKGGNEDQLAYRTHEKMKKRGGRARRKSASLVQSVTYMETIREKNY